MDMIASLPDISFIENKTLDDVQAQLVSAYEEKYKEVTGRDLSLKRADAETLKLYACSVVLYQHFCLLDKSAKMSLLKYSYGDFLEHLGALRGVSRLPAASAVTTLRFTLSEAQGSAITIPAGTRASNGTELYFATDKAMEIPSGELTGEVSATCTTTGAEANGILAGAMSTLVDPIAYVESVINTDETEGGADVEDDAGLAERVYLAPGSYSVAGPIGAYKYYAKSFSSAVGDVEVTSPTPCVVEIRFLMEDRDLPSESVIEGMAEYLDDETIRPLTDQVRVMAPTEVGFDIDLTYYINASDKAQAATIQSKVAKAVDGYIAWQTGVIGRDINPSVLTRYIVAAGAKRVEVTAPAFAGVAAGHVARLGSQSVTYGGLEND